MLVACHESVRGKCARIDCIWFEPRQGPILGCLKCEVNPAEVVSIVPVKNTLKEYNAELLPVGEKAYRIRTTEDSSHRYGNCEICGKHCAEVFIQSSIKVCEIDGKKFAAHDSNSFGHEECLIAKRGKDVK